MRYSDRDKNNTVDRYVARLNEFGYSPKTLGWNKGNQRIRFDALTSRYDFTDKSVLDIGCGFGDLNETLRARYGHRYQYLGLDIVPNLIEIATSIYGDETTHFLTGDFLDTAFEQTFDFAIASGIFNHQLEETDSYEFIEACISKALEVCREGLAFDFLSDKVEYRHEHTFHSSPEKILSIAYHHSRKLVLLNDYMPFEFSLVLFKDDTFSASKSVFRR